MDTKNETPVARPPEEKQDRLKKLELIKQSGMLPYADKYSRTYTIGLAKEAKEDTSIRTAGRLILLREMGKLTFAHIFDLSGKIQVIFRIGEIDQETYKTFLKVVSVGDFIGVEGNIFTTKKGEKSILVKKYTFLSKALKPLPEKWHGLKDIETKYRKRYLDLISNEETAERFKFRSDFIWDLREFYRNNGFYEIDTPVLGNSASGALAKPFKTHYNSLDIDVYLRIAPEIYLKEAIIGGFDKVFEIARVFRNEGMDPSHLQDFTMIEHYCAYWDFEDNMDFTEKMLSTVVQKLRGTTKFKTLNRNEELVEVDLAPPWRKVSFRELLIADCGIDIDLHPGAESLRDEISNKGIELENTQKLGRGNLIDALYKKVSRPNLIGPVFLVNHPVDLSPLARRNDKSPLVTDRFQLVINGWEIVNAYSELIDPTDQKERLLNQMKLKQGGDEEAMSKDDEYIEAMEYGMPPVSGWGMGVERMLALLTQQSNLRDVVLFPLLKPRIEDTN